MPVSLALPRLSPCSVPVLHTASSRDGRPAPSSCLDRNLSPQQPRESARPSGLPGKLLSQLAACGGSLCTQEGPQLCPGRQHPPPAPWLLVEAAPPPGRAPSSTQRMLPAPRGGGGRRRVPRLGLPPLGRVPSCHRRPYSLPGAGSSVAGGTSLTAHLRRRAASCSPAPRAASGPSGDLSDNWLTALPSVP